MTNETPTPNEDDVDWLITEMNLTAERAKERGMTPTQFLLGLRTYAKQFARSYGVIDTPANTDDD